MRNRTRRCLAMLGLLTVAFHAAAEPPRFAEGRVLMAPRAGLPAHALERILANANARAIERIGAGGARVLQVPAGTERQAVAQLRGNPHVDYAELDQLTELQGAVPDDPQFGAAWHLSKMRVPDAWTAGTGAGVVVAVLDSGVDARHPDLGANVLSGWNAVSQTAGNSADLNGHGTKVAGTVAALTNNSMGVAAIAHDAQVLPVRVSDRGDGWAYWSDIARGLHWAADNGADVANISYDVSGSSSVTSAAQYFRENGGVVVVAAGNSGTDPGYAANAYMVSVSATGTSDTRTSWSSFGSYVDVAAPGAGIWTTTLGGGYGAVSGTSFASPATAAVVAQMRSANQQLAPAQLEAILLDSAVDLGAAGWDIYYGAGRVDAAAAVGAAAAMLGTDTNPPTSTVASPTGGTAVFGLVAVTATASDDVGVSTTELFVDGVLIGTDNTAPYAFTWDSAGRVPGPASIRVRATDAAGNVTDSAAVSVTVLDAPDSTPPHVSLYTPLDGDVVSGSFTIGASATDDVAVERVDVHVDGSLACSGTSAASCSINTRKMGAGTVLAITASARDTAGNSASAALSVTVGASKKRGGGNDGGGDGSPAKGGGKNKK